MSFWKLMLFSFVEAETYVDVTVSEKQKCWATYVLNAKIIAPSVQVLGLRVAMFRPNH